MSPFVKNTNRHTTQPPLHERRNVLDHMTVRPTTNTNRRRGNQGGGDVEADGEQPRREAPGQLCAYIPPGNQADEIYRLATFAKYPTNVPANIADFAAAGLYYTGFRDRVKCFSCGTAVENWVAGDYGLDKKWHRNDCKLMNGFEPLNQPRTEKNLRALVRRCQGLDNPVEIRNSQNSSMTEQIPLGPLRNATANVQPNTPIDVVTTNMANFQLAENGRQQPIRIANVESPEHEALLRRLNLRSEADRRKTFDKWPSYPAPFLPSQLARDGFFYLGNMDRTQCFCCSGILRNWSSADNVHEQHRVHLPACRIVRGLNTENIPMTEAQREGADERDQARVEELQSAGRMGEPPNPSAEEQRHLATHFPCNQPANPHMESLQARIASFGSRWPATVTASIEHIARSGFFFLGESDKTKCFYCNGGLQNWEAEDEPWTEHAKWFPGCAYVLRQKGVEFARRLKEAHPNLNRPNIRNSVSYDIPPVGLQRPPATRIDDNQPRLNINQVVRMGFSRGIIDNAIQRRRGGYATTEELIDDLIEGDLNAANALTSQPSSLEGEVTSMPIAVNAEKRRGQNEEEATLTKKTRTSSPTALEGSEMAESLKAKKAEVLCRKCRVTKASVVFTPCGHLCVCESCSNDMKKCILCDSKVQNAVKVFRA